MRRFKIFLSLLLFAGGVPAFSQPASGYTVARDLRAAWFIYDGKGYRSYEDQEVKTIYFTLDATSYRGDFLYLRSNGPLDIFIHQKLILQTHGGGVGLPIDSLARIYSPALSVAVFQKGGIRLLQTTILSPAIASADTDRVLRKKNFFLDFSLLAALFLSVYFVLLFRTNPRLTLDYLNVTKLLSVHEREENLLAARVTSSVNLLFYLFSALCCGLVLLAIFQFGAEQVWVARYFSIHSVGEGFLQWAKLSAIILGWLAMKLMIIYIFSGLFNLKDISAIQYFNFIRMVFIVTGLMAVICSSYFVYYGYPTGPHVNLLKASAVVMAFSVVMIFLKLMTLAPFSFFHLFSYLCASEIIPLVILLKVLLY